MSRAEDAIFAPRPTDDPLFRIGRQAENRAHRNGRTADESQAAARLATRMLRRSYCQVAKAYLLSHESIVSKLAGAFRRV